MYQFILIPFIEDANSTSTRSAAVSEKKLTGSSYAYLTHACLKRMDPIFKVGPRFLPRVLGSHLNAEADSALGASLCGKIYGVMSNGNNGHAGTHYEFALFNGSRLSNRSKDMQDSRSLDHSIKYGISLVEGGMVALWFYFPSVSSTEPAPVRKSVPIWSFESQLVYLYIKAFVQLCEGTGDRPLHRATFTPRLDFSIYKLTPSALKPPAHKLQVRAYAQEKHC
ncbi:hypothetical protein F5051DRAFT_427184 [Lentinula edodes]|nr:hypothetical protein F5051DRAFT_427184 [Lentinula edodes]